MTYLQYLSFNNITTILLSIVSIKSAVCSAEASVDLTLLMCEHHSIMSCLLFLLPEDNKPRGAAQAGRVCDAGPRQLPGHAGDPV